MIFSPNPEKAARWWAGVLDAEVHLDVNGDSVFAWLDLAGTEFGFHQADNDRNPPGGSPVPYWSVKDVDQVRERLLEAGCGVLRHGGLWLWLRVGLVGQGEDGPAGDPQALGLLVQLA